MFLRPFCQPSLTNTSVSSDKNSDTCEIASVIEPVKLRLRVRSESANFLNLAKPSSVNSGVF